MAKKNEAAACPRVDIGGQAVLDGVMMKAAWDKLPAEKQAERFPIGVLCQKEYIDYAKAYDTVIEKAGGRA